MKEWEKELYIYRLTPAPPKENDLQKYILNHLAEKNDKYISWFLHYYERTLNEKAMAIVQDYHSKRTAVNTNNSTPTIASVVAFKNLDLVSFLLIISTP